MAVGLIIKNVKTNNEPPQTPTVYVVYVAKNNSGKKYSNSRLLLSFVKSTMYLKCNQYVLKRRQCNSRFERLQIII